MAGIPMLLLATGAGAVSYTHLDVYKRQGTGQATEPILNTGCDYHAIELGEHLADMMKSKYGKRVNFDIVNADFIIHDFGNQRFDMIYSAATIQWIPEDIAFQKTFDL